jgi:hypothetical protein
MRADDMACDVFQPLLGGATAPSDPNAFSGKLLTFKYGLRHALNFRIFKSSLDFSIAWWGGAS